MDEQFRKHSLWPLWGILIGFGAALVLIPEYRHMQVGALIPSGLALSFGLLIPVLAAVLRSPDAIFRFEHLLMFGVFYWVVLDAAQGAYHLWGISYAAIVKSFFMISLFSMCVWIGSLAASFHRFTNMDRELVEVDKNFLYWAILGSFVLGSLRAVVSCDLDPGCLAEGLGAPRFEAAWQTADIGRWDTLLVNLQMLGNFILPLTVAYHNLERRISWRVALCALLGLLFVLFLIQDGGRRQVGMVLGASVIVWVLLNRPIRWKNIVVIGLVLSAVLYLMDIMVVWRTHGVMAVFEEKNYQQIVEPHEPLIRVDKNLRYMGNVIDVVPEQHPHTGWRGIYSVLAAPIPRSVLPDKPGLNAFPIRQYVPNLPSSPTWSWTCTAICDFYLIGGYLFVAGGGLLFGVIARVGNGLLAGRMTVRKALYYGILAMTLFVGLRAIREVVILGSGLVALWGVLYLRYLLFKRWYMTLRTST